LRRADYAVLTQQLPGLLDELQVQAVTAGGAHRDLALRLLIQASASAMITLRHFGLSDLAWLAPASPAIQASSTAKRYPPETPDLFDQGVPNATRARSAT